MGGFISGLDPNTATLLSGAMSMVGGAIGAAGAYWVANTQIKKQFLKQDKDRVLELRIEKLNEVLTTTNIYLGNIKSDKKVADLIRNKIEKSKDATLRADSDLNKGMIDEVKLRNQKYDSFVSKLVEYKIFIPDGIDIKEINNATNTFLKSYKSFLFKLEGFATSIPIHDLKNNPNTMNDCEVAYQKLDSKLEEVIGILENEIKKLLKI
jgi:gas vesicle protein